MQSTVLPFRRNSLAIATPSPPLFPGPQTTEKLLAFSYSFSIVSTTLRAALSIKTKDGISCFSIVLLSQACICLADINSVIIVPRLNVRLDSKLKNLTTVYYITQNLCILQNISMFD